MVLQVLEDPSRHIREGGNVDREEEDNKEGNEASCGPDGREHDEGISQQESNIKSLSQTPSDVDSIPEEILQQELETIWILNLSMHFRDDKNQEKFFITYAEMLTQWRRVTVLCDYREAVPGSLEYDLCWLDYQHNKSAEIYKALHGESLQDVHWYPTVMNLKLKTHDRHLHVHVAEDVSEIIPYPGTSSITHLKYKAIEEQDLEVESHLSIFVYKVRINNEENGKDKA